MSRPQWARAVRLAAERFPEVALEQAFVEHEGLGQDLWVCRAPSRDELRRWADAADLPIRGVRHVSIFDPEHRAGSREAGPVHDDEG